MNNQQFVGEVVNVSKIFGEEVVALERINLSIVKGEFLSLIGPSGCGKTTLLRIFSGLETPTSGEVRIEGKDVTHLPANRRATSMVFQRWALFPHKSVSENVAFGLRMKQFPREKIKDKVMEMLDLVGLIDFADRRPNQLSGGQQQRVALARSIAVAPPILLLDEPLGSLDLKLRKKMELELKKIHRRLGITFIFVTHDQEEAMIMSDRIVVMNAGRIEETGTPVEIYTKARTRFTAEFIGNSNLLEGKILSADTRRGVADISGHRIAIENDGTLQKGGRVYVSLKAMDVEMGKTLEGYPNLFSGNISEISYVGNLEKYFIDIGHGVEIVLEKPGRKRRQEYAIGEQVTLGWMEEDCHVVRDRGEAEYE